MRGGCSAVGYKPIVGHVVPDRMGERNDFSFGNGSSIDAATQELVKECLVVIDSHTGPASALHLGIEKRLLTRESACLQSAEHNECNKCAVA